MKIYIAGPMRGYQNFNFPAFDEARDTLESMGHLAISPADMDRTLDGFDPAKDKPKDMRYYMKRDLPKVMECEAIALLPGWKQSSGALLEAHVAFRCGLKLFEYQPGIGLTSEIKDCPVVHCETLPDVVIGPCRPATPVKFPDDYFKPYPPIPWRDDKQAPAWPRPNVVWCGGFNVHLN